MILRDTNNTLVHLVPYPIVAKVGPASSLPRFGDDTPTQ
jgi:hypothetical protein